MIPPVLYNALLRRHTSRRRIVQPRDVGAPFSGRVVYIPDGDGFSVSLGNRLVSVRLYGIDAPERGQAFFTQSRYFLAGQIWSKPVKCFPMATDKYNRLICDCYGLSRYPLSLLSVLYGYSWHYSYFAPDDNALRDAQRLARTFRRGLWHTKYQVAPWVFRLGKKNRK